MQSLTFRPKAFCPRDISLRHIVVLLSLLFLVVTHYHAVHKHALSKQHSFSLYFIEYNIVYQQLNILNFPRESNCGKVTKSNRAIGGDKETMNNDRT